MPGPKGTVRNPILVILYSILTCGIYGIWWWYTTLTELKNYTQDEEINPTTNVILLIFLGCIWQFVIAYKMGKWIANAQRISGLPEEDKSTTYLILTLLCLGIVVYYLIQTELNKIWESGTGVPAQPQYGGYPPSTPTPGTGI